MGEAAKTYAQALYDLAAEEDLSGVILEDLRCVRAAFEENPEYAVLLSEPSIGREERKNLLDEAFGQAVHTYTLSFLKLLCDRDLMRKVPQCEAAYRRLYNDSHGILPVECFCALPLSGAQTEKLCQVLEKRTGKHIELIQRVDPSVVGGIRLELQGVSLDGTVQHHLDELSRILSASM